MKVPCLLLACDLLAACAHAPAPKLEAPPPAVPLLIGSPVDAAAVDSLEARLAPKDDAQVLLRFTVQPDGAVHNAVALMSKLPDDTSAAVVAAFSALRFRPYRAADTAVARDFIYPLFFGPGAVPERTRFLCRHEDERYQPADRCDTVTLGNWRVYRVTPPYPAAQLADPVSGSVDLAFDLDPSGVPSNVTVVKSTPPGLFDTAAVVALQQWYFEPLDGSAAGAAQHASVTLNFKPPAARNNGGGK